MRRSTVVTVLALSLSSLALGCGEGGPPARAPSAPGEAPPPIPVTTAAAVPAAEKVTSLRRSQVKQTISRGVGYFLQNVALDDWPVMRDGKFYGFRLRAINADWGVDLRAGDVVTRVNGMVIEHPEEADAALRALDKATALRVDYERDGKPLKLELPIVED